ncbi:hypothetical protein E2320_000068, partial [Naja naja]
TCVNDDDCPLTEKCCFTGCGRGCLPSDKKKCVSFLGCEGSRNSFQTRELCEKACGKISKEVCKLPADPGRCLAYLEQYYYNWNTRKCETFVYGMCNGNGNRFATKLECQMTNSNSSSNNNNNNSNSNNSNNNSKSPKNESLFNIPAWKHDKGPCDKLELRWCHDAKSERFLLWSVSSLEAAMGTLTTTRTSANVTAAVSPQKILQVSTSLVGVPPSFQTFTYFVANSAPAMPAAQALSAAGRPLAGSNVNSQKEVSLVPGLGGRTRFKHEVCKLPADPGRCLAYLEQYYYNWNTRKCETFVYGMCNGNGNRFTTKLECQIVFGEFGKEQERT